MSKIVLNIIKLLECLLKFNQKNKRAITDDSVYLKKFFDVFYKIKFI